MSVSQRDKNEKEKKKYKHKELLYCSYYIYLLSYQTHHMLLADQHLLNTITSVLQKCTLYKNRKKMFEQFNGSCSKLTGTALTVLYFSSLRFLNLFKT